MEETQTTLTSPDTPPTRTPLVRPVQGRMVAGVAKGLANHLGIADWIPRLIFVVTLFMGGLGIALYAAGWAFIRSEDEAESPVERVLSGSLGPKSWLGLALIALGAIVILDLFTVLDGQVVWATALLVVGLLMYLGHVNPPTRRSDREGEPTVEGGAGNTNPSGSGESVTTPLDLPTPPPPLIPAHTPREPSILGRLTIGVILLGLGALAIVDNVDALPIDADPRHYLALAVTIIGIGLLVGSVMGRARWLIVLGILMIPTLLFSPVFEFDWQRDGFDRFVVPATFAELEESYELDAGNLVIDLTELNWRGETVRLTARVEVGNIEVRVPEDVAIEGRATADVGRVAGPDGESFGLGDPTIDFAENGSLGLLVLEAEVDAGNIQIVYR